MEPEFEDGQIAWVLKQDMVENGEIGIFSLNGEAYIKKLQDDKNGVFLFILLNIATFLPSFSFFTFKITNLYSNFISTT